MSVFYDARTVPDDMAEEESEYDGEEVMDSSSSDEAEIVEEEEAVEAYHGHLSNEDKGNGTKRKMNVEPSCDAGRRTLCFKDKSHKEAVDVKPMDVMCGRGKDCFSHSGNRRFRTIVDKYLPFYLNAQSRTEKTEIVTALVDGVHQVGGRFLKRDGKRKAWYVLNETQSKEKAGHAIRDATISEESKKDRAAKRRLKRHASSQKKDGKNHTSKRGRRPQTMLPGTKTTKSSKVTKSSKATNSSMATKSSNHQNLPSSRQTQVPIQFQRQNVQPWEIEMVMNLQTAGRKPLSPPAAARQPYLPPKVLQKPHLPHALQKTPQLLQQTHLPPQEHLPPHLQHLVDHRTLDGLFLRQHSSRSIDVNDLPAQIIQQHSALNNTSSSVRRPDPPAWEHAIGIEGERKYSHNSRGCDPDPDP